MKNLKKLLEKEVRFYKSPWEMDITNKELLKACLPVLQKISEDEELDTMFCSELIGVIDFLKTLTK